jgi:serine/threonine protein kinase/tetratricopeptide (TPR) repeat protein
MGISRALGREELGDGDRLFDRPIGHYRLQEKIGEGGGGVVYRAVQEHPVQREVALKILKPGMDTRAVIARFEAERQALALMNHPHIAKVFDAGETEEGRPYFVMELAPGCPITTFCARHRTPLRARLELFILVCQALQHAHQKGIIHRDIKPSNVLVDLADGLPTPRVIDFGIAKALQHQLSGETLTQEHHFLGTPAYVSPEQATLGGQDVDTRSDIYSLGVLLYELLTGTTPLDEIRGRSAGLEEILKMIREIEPEKPSVRARRLGAGFGDPPDAAGPLDPDLDWMVLKALEKERARRYDTAADFAADIRRHLDHQPVLARPPTTVYQVRKFARRHRGAVLAGGLVLFVLLAGILVSTWLAVRATRAEREQNRLYQQADRARAGEAGARQKSEQVARFLERMLKGVGPSVALGRDTKLLREILDRTAAGLKDELAGQPEVEADLRGTIGEVYFALGSLPSAEAMQRESLRLRETSLPPDHVEVAESLNRLANVLQALNRTDEAVACYRRSLAIYRSHGRPAERETAALLSNLGNALSTHDLPAAEQTLREALALSRQLHRGGTPSPSILYSLGLVLKDRGQLGEAEKFLRESLQVRREQLDPIHPEIALTLSSLGDLLRDRGRPDEAETNLVEAVAIQRKLHDGPHPGLASALGNLALLLDSRRRFAEAEVMCRESLDYYRRMGNQELKEATTLNNLARIRLHRGAGADAESLFETALELRKKVLGPEHPTLVVLLNNLGATERQLAQGAKAEAHFREAIAMGRKFPGDADRDTIDAWRALASMLAARGDRTNAADALVEALRLQRQRLPPTSRTLEMSIYETADVLYRAGRFVESEPLFREALEKRRGRLPSDDDAVITVAAGLGRLLADWAWIERPSSTSTNFSASAAGRPAPEALQRARTAVELLNECRAALRHRTDVALSRRADLQSRWAAASVAVAVNDPGMAASARIACFIEAEKSLLDASTQLESPGTEARLRSDNTERLKRLYLAWELAEPGAAQARDARRGKNTASP